ncbi:MAG: PAS domain-containing protein [Clostridia bacterium]|nr:PAS domain-containing protein [Clostridia bacterium]
MKRRVFLCLFAMGAAAALLASAAWLAGGGGLTAIITAVLLVAAAFGMANLFTAFIMEPVQRLHIHTKVSANEPSYYPEFQPLVDRLLQQEKEIQHQLFRVDKEKNRLATIIYNMDEGLIILDNNLRVIMLNESAHRLLGTTLSRSDCAGRSLHDVCPSREICGCIERADSMDLTLDGRNLQLHVNHVVTGAEQVGRIGLILDVTERNEIERIKQEFTANVSHELKTPLTSISGYAELIEAGMAQGNDAVIFAGRIRRESARMLALISDIIKLSQLDEASDADAFEPVELHRLCEECMDTLEMSAQKHEVTLSLEGGTCELSGVPSELTELVYNLIDNGIRYNRPGGSVKVKIAPPPAGSPGLVMLSVSDTGIGIAKEHQARVFERFYRVDKSRSKATGGTGLGLAIVKHVAERHGAKLELESRIGEGTTIRVIFYDNVSENL